MTAFFQNIYAWVCANGNKIVGVLTSTTFIGMLTMLFNMIRTIKTNKSVNLTGTELKAELVESSKNRTVINTIKDVSDKIKEVSESTKKALDETAEALDRQVSIVMNKVNAMLEVQSLVYSTIRDDSLRQTVSNLLNTARYNDTNTKAQLQAEIDSLKQALNEKMAEVNQTMSEAIDKVQTVVEAPKDSTSDTAPTRY